MCTVTYLPLRNSILLTSNRDERIVRLPALLPEKYKGNSGEMLMPKDGQAGGTWIAVHNNGNAMVLLNGAFKKHWPNTAYRKSRGLVFIEIFDGYSPTANFDCIDLQGIEPFTLVIWEHGKLIEAKWDGVAKYIMPLSVTEPRIWSSVTLYDAETTTKRKTLFEQWLNDTPYRTGEQIRLFHEFAYDGDINIKMKDNGQLQTVSITCIEIMNRKVTMHYKDMMAGLVSVNEWHITSLLQNS